MCSEEKSQKGGSWDGTAMIGTGNRKYFIFFIGVVYLQAYKLLMQSLNTSGNVSKYIYCTEM